MAISRMALVFSCGTAVALMACEDRAVAVSDAAPVVVEAPPQAAPAPVYAEVGKASWYGPWHRGHKTASGERFDPGQLTAAHPTLPLGTEATVTNLETGKSVEVRINDRGPYVKDRAIDLSAKAAALLGMKQQGLALVKIEARPEGSFETASAGS
jgi:rare lipoprotein A (peptidoglycan hydrolase)